MKGKISLLTRKIFATVIAVAMSIPPTAFANANEPVVYTENSSIMGIRENKEELPRIENTDKTKLSKDLGSYNLEIKANLDPSLTKINYTIKAKRKEKLAEDKQGKLSLSLTKTPSSNLNDLQLISANTENQTNEPDFKAEGLPSLVITSKAKDEIIYELSADVNKAKDQRSYKLILSLAEEAKSEVLAYNLKVEKGLSLKDGQEVETVELVNEDDESPLIKGEYKKEGILGGLFASQDSITWEAFILNEEENQEITYDFNLDKNQDPTNSKIAIDYYEPTDKGFEIKREFLQTIDFAKKIKFEIPKGHLAKLTLKTKVSKKNTKVKSYSLNNGVVKNPIYIEGNEEEKSNDDEEPAQKEENKKYQKDPTDKDTVEVKPSEIKPESKPEAKPGANTAEPKDKAPKQDKKTGETELLVKDANGNEIPVKKIEDKNQNSENNEPKISALQLNKEGLISKIKSEGNLNKNTESAIEELTNKLDTYNDGKIIHQEILDFIKSIAERYVIDKKDLRTYIDYILSGLNKDVNPAARLDADEIIKYSYPVKSSTTDIISDAEIKDKKVGETKNPEVSVDQKNINPSPDESKDQTNKTPDSSTNKKPANDKKPSATNENDKNVKTNKPNESLLSRLKNGLTNILGTKEDKNKDISGYEKADRELKAAIKSGKSLSDIQDLLNKLEEKYSLSPTEQEKLMTSNNQAILDLVEKHRKGNTFLNFFRAYENDPLKGKQFNVKTYFQTNTNFGPIMVGQYFKIKLDKKLTVNPQRSIDPIKNPQTGRVIATGQYMAGENAIWYKVVEPIRENLNLPLNIPVDYNIEEIRKTTAVTDTFQVENFVSGFGVVNPRSLGKATIDRDGNVVGNIIGEEGKPPVDAIFDTGINYRVQMRADSSPVVENGKLTAIDWTISFVSDHNLNDNLIDLRTNFTIVDGSGFEKIEKIYLNGKPIETQENKMDEKGGRFLIKDSQYHKADQPGKTYTYTFRTKVADPQSVYCIDIASYLKGVKKMGAVRLVSNGYPESMLRDLTPNRASANSRTTIKGEFLSDSKHGTTMAWKVTDEVSTGDDGRLPLATRELSDNQSIYRNNGGVEYACYEMDNNGKMIQTQGVTTLTDGIPAKGTGFKKDPGTIAVYKINTTKKISSTGNTYSLSGVNISLHQDLDAQMTWEINDQPIPPTTTLETKTGDNTVQTEVPVGLNTRGAYVKDFVINDVKVWKIGAKGKYEKLNPTFTQSFDPKQRLVGNTNYEFVEREIYYDQHDKKYIIKNTAREQILEKTGSFTIVKTDEAGNPLPGAVFALNGDEGKRTGITTGADGRIKVSDVKPGSYTLLETKAPIGYKRNTESKIVNINSRGEINNPSDIKTEYLSANSSKEYFMNTYDYAKVSKDKKTIDYYIYLKPKSDDPPNYNSTDRNTRLYINIKGASLQDTDIYDISPRDRAKVSQAMLNQNADLLSGLTSVKNVASPGTETIRQDYGNDAYTGNVYNEGQGFIYWIPKSRLYNNWGFLVKVTANLPDNATSVNPKFYWMCDFKDVNGVKNNWKIERTNLNIPIPSDNQASDVFTFVNKKFESQDVKLDKVDKNGNPVAGAEFSLLTMGDHPQLIAKQISDNQGSVNFGKVSPGTYELYETKAPDGYFKSSVHFHVKVADSGLVSYEGMDQNDRPVDPGNRYWLDQKQINDPELNKPTVTVKDAKIELIERGTGSKPDIWEGFEFETFAFSASISMSNVSLGQTFDIKLDSRWDLSRLLNDKLPEIKDRDSGVVIAKPYINKKTNLITYVFNEKAVNAQVDMKLEIQGLYPSPYFVRDNKQKVTFKNVVNASGENPVEVDNTFEAYYGDYLKKGNYAGTFTYPAIKSAITDTYVSDEKDPDGSPKLKSRAVFYYNPEARVDRKTNKINIDWAAVDKGTSEDLAVRNRFGMPMDLRRVKVYRVDRTDSNGTHESLMPQSMGVKPAEDPENYTLIADFDIGNSTKYSQTSGNVSLDYDKSRKYAGMFYRQDEQTAPLMVQLPRISQKEGYIIETYFDVTDKRLYQDYYRQVIMEINGPYDARMARVFTQKAGEATAKSEQTDIEIPKIYIQILKLINDAFKPGQFVLTKIDQVTRKPIDGVIFTLSDPLGNEIVKKTDSQGKIYFDNLRPGTYVLKETKAKDGYAFTDRKWSVEVDTAGNTTIKRVSFGNEEISKGEITIENRPVGAGFKLYKLGDNNKALAGAKFKLTKEGSTDIQEKTSEGEHGEVKFENLEPGTYYLKEIEAPKGYKPLKKKWKIVIDNDRKAKIYQQKESSDPAKNAKFGLMKGMSSVDAASQATDTWKKGFPQDERYFDYAYDTNTPNGVGTRIIGIDKNTKQFVQRFVINPEGSIINQEITAYISRQREGINNNMDWYAKNGVLNENYIKIYTIENPVKGKVADIDVNQDTATDVTDLFYGSVAETTNSANQKIKQLKLSMLEAGKTPSSLTATELEAFKKKLDKISYKPIIVEVKTNYNSNDGEIGLGMQASVQSWIYFKRDFYEKASGAVEFKTEDDTSYEIVGEDSLVLKNERTKTSFKLRKISDSNKPIEDAKFSLEGRGTTEYKKKEATTGKDGTITFDGLTVGEYTLKEEKPAPGYEAQGDGKYWILKVTEDSESPDGYKMELTDEKGQGPTPTPDPPKPGETKTTVESNPKDLQVANSYQDTGIVIKNRKVGDPQTLFTILDEDSAQLAYKFIKNSDGSETLFINPGLNVDGPVKVTIKDDDLKTDSNPNGEKTITLNVAGHEARRDDNKSNKLKINTTGQKRINPDSTNQGTGIILENRNRPVRVDAVDEDGQPVGATIDEQTGEIFLQPPDNVDGPIELTISSTDLQNGSATLSVGVNGHSLNVDDNYSDFYIWKKYSDEDWMPPVSPNYQDTGYRLFNKKGYVLNRDYTLSFVDEDGNTNIPYNVNSDGTIGIVTQNLDGPVKMTLTSRYLKGGSKDYTINIAGHKKNVDDNKSDTRVTGKSEYIPRNNTGFYYTGYQIISPNNDYDVSVVDDHGNRVTFWDGQGYPPPRPYLQMYGNSVAINPTTELDGPLTMTVESPTLKGEKNFKIHIQGEVEDQPDNRPKTYHLQKEDTNGATIYHPIWRNFMNYRTSIIGGSENDGYLKARIFLNPDTGIARGQNGRGPDNETKLILEKNAATEFNVKVYWVRSSQKSKYMNDTSYPPSKFDRHFREVKDGDGDVGGPGTYSFKDRGTKYELTFPINTLEDKRWAGNGYIVEIEANYPKDSYDATKAAPPKLINYDWKSTQTGANLEGDLGFRKVENPSTRSVRTFSARSMDTRASLLANRFDSFSPINFMSMSMPLSLAKNTLEISNSIKPKALKSSEDDLEINKPAKAQAQQAGEDRTPGTPRSAFTFEFDAKKKEATIVNKQVGIKLFLNKKDTQGRPLQNAEFKLTRIKKLENGSYVDSKREIFEGIKTDDEGKLESPPLLPGIYELQETKAPVGYVVPPAPWIIEVKEENGILRIYQKPPGLTSKAYISSTSAATVRPANHKKIFSYKLVAIDTERRTFTIRMFINPEGVPNDRPYSFDFFPENHIFADQADEGEAGVMFNYRTTYRVSNPAKYEHRELNLLNLKSPDIDLINTARFRPYRYGFTQDLINIKNISQTGGEAVGYVVDLDGSYTKDFFNKNNNQLKIDFWFGDIKPGKFEKGVTKWKNWGEVENIANTDGKDQYVVKPFKEELVDGTWKPYKNPAEDKVYHMNFDLSKLFVSNDSIPVENTGMDIYNRDETYNMAFTKYDANHHDIDIEKTKDKLVRLEGAVFQLQKKELDEYKDIQGYALATAFNGFVGFNNLAPGDYRIIEIKPPRRKITKKDDGKEVVEYINYRKIEGPVMEFTLKRGSKPVTITDSDGTQHKYTRKGEFILTKRHSRYIPTREVINAKHSGLINQGEKIVENPEHDIPDYVTHATQQFGKVLNDAAGKGKIEVNKTGDDGRPLKGAKFRVTRISAFGSEKATAVSDEIETNKDGFIRFENLPIGNYILEEISAPPGYQVDRQARTFTVGGKGNDPYYEVPKENGKDLSEYITYDSQKIYHVNDLKNEIGGNSKSNARGSIDPNSSESLVFVNKFVINKDQMLKDKVGIKAGDKFTIKLSENINLSGIDEREIGGLSIIEDGVGTIAHAKYDKAKGTITYIFTDFARSYTLDNFTSTINAYFDKDKVKTSTPQEVSLSLGDQTKSKWVNVNYSLARGHTEYNYENLDISTKIVNYNPDTGDFVQYAYVNRDFDAYSSGMTFRFEPGKAVENVNIKYYKIEAGDAYTKRNLLPISFGVDETDLAKYFKPEEVNVGKMGANDRKDINLGGPQYKYDAYFVKISGKVIAGTESFKPTAWVLDNQYPVIHAKAWSWANFQENISQAKIDFSVNMPNKKNKIIFEKVDQFDKIVKGAKFELYKVTNKDSSGRPQTYSLYTDGDNSFTSGEDGRIEIKGLPKGDYALKEIQAPDDYKILDEWTATFIVDETGHFKDVVTNYKKGNQPQPQKGENIDDADSIHKMVNEKTYKYRFQKIDSKTKSPLPGAEFQLYYREKEFTYTYEKNTGKVIKKEEVPWEKDNKQTSDKNGIVEFEFTKPGYYQIREVKAPDGYLQVENKVIKDFVLENGEVKVKVKARAGLVAKDPSSTDKDTSLMLMTKTDQSGWKYLDTTIEINPTYKPMTFGVTNDDGYTSDFNINCFDNIEITNDNAEFYLVGKNEQPSAANKKQFSYVWKQNLGMGLNLYKLLEGNGRDPVTTDKKLVIKFKTIDRSKDENKDLMIKTTLKANDQVAIYKFKSSDILTPEQAADPNYSVLQPYEYTTDESKLQKVENIKTHKFIFKKVDSADKTPLEGAEFRLFYKESKDGSYQELDPSKLYKSGADGKVEIDGLYKNGYYAIKETKAPRKYIAPRDFVKEFSIIDGVISVDGAPLNASFVTKVDVSKYPSYVNVWALRQCYSTSITMKYNTDHMPVTYTKNKAKLTLSGLPKKNQTYGDHTVHEGISIDAYLTDGNTRTKIKTYKLDLNEYSRDYASRTIDLFELVKELEGKTGDADITTSKTLVLSMDSNLDLNTQLDLGSKLIIGDETKDNSIKDDKTFHIGTKGDAYESDSYTFDSKVDVSSNKEITVENHKVVLPKAFSTNAWIGYTIGGILVMIAAAYIYHRKRQAA